MQEAGAILPNIYRKVTRDYPIMPLNDHIIDINLLHNHVHNSANLTAEFCGDRYQSTNDTCRSDCKAVHACGTSRIIWNLLHHIE